MTPPPDSAASGKDGLPVALLGHDLRATLAEMRAGLHMLESLDLPAAQRLPIERCRAVGESLGRLIDQSVLVCLGQGSAGLSGQTEVETDRFLSDMRKRWSARAAESGHSFHLVTAGDLPPRFVIDLNGLDRVLSNLIANALVHTPPGPVRVTFKISGGDLLLLVVEDDGPGFPDPHLPALMQDFAIPPEARRPGGGFGLQSVKRLVDAMGGRANARNKHTGGAEVGICLPLPPQTQDVAEAALAAPPDLTGTRILYADDSPAQRDLVTALARLIGAEITCVTDGAAAMQALADGPLPDVLILDSEMPRMSGPDVLNWLRASEGPRARVPVLALTSHIGAAQTDALRSAGAAEVLAKPVLCPLELGRAILRAQGLESPTPAPGSPLAHEAPSGTDAAEIAALEKLRQIAGPAAAAEIFARLMEDLSHLRVALANAAQKADMTAIRAQSHVLVALAGTAGAMTLHEDAIRLNTLAQDGKGLAAAVALALQMDTAIAQLVHTVQKMAKRRTEA